MMTEPDIEKAITSKLTVATNARTTGVPLAGLRAKWRAEVLAENGNVAAERDCLAMAVMFALQWDPSAPMGLREGIEEILTTMPPAAGQDTSTATAADTLPEWLHQRFGRYRQGWAPWRELSDDDRAYWAHEAAAVRRSTDRGGFKTPPAADAYAGTRGEPGDVR